MRILFANQRFEGERVIQTAPEISNRVSSEECYLRPRLYTGRALTADTLISNTKHHLRHMQMFGRHLSGGVIEGLTLTSYVRNDEGNLKKAVQWLRLTAGIGITRWGDDITLPETADVLMDNVPTWEGESPPAENPPRGAGIFVLQPLEIRDEVVSNEKSQCQWDEESDSFSDEQVVDACRLVFVPWPGYLLGPVPDFQSSQFRNKLVYTIFDYEKAHPDELFPWKEIGVPVGLAYITTDTGTILFIDQQAVVRKGGAPLSTKNMLPMNGTPFLWESRIQQFIGHLYDISQSVNEIPDARSHFEALPPVGIVPRQALDFDNMSTVFFPSQFIIDAAPIPEEQLEAAMNASAGLEPFDLHQPEKIKLLVPVPQAVYEPDLLKKEEPDPVFLETLRKLVREIRQYLEDRKYLRSMAGKVIGAIDAGKTPAFEDDSDAVPDEAIFPVTLTHHDNITDFGAKAVDAIRNLYSWIRENASGVSDKLIESLLRFPERNDGLKNVIHALMFDIQKSNSLKNLENISMNVKSVEEQNENRKRLDDFIINLKSETQEAKGFKALENFIDNIKDDIKIGDRKDEVFQAFKGIENFIIDLKNDIQKTEDILDSAYVKTESDMYRLRQQMLGNGKATRLATSPALGQIISSEDTQLTGAAVESYLNKAKDTKTQTGTTASETKRINMDLKSDIDASETTLKEARSDLFIKSRILKRQKPLIKRIYESPSVEVKTNAVQTKSSIIDYVLNIPFEMDDEVTIAGNGKGVIKELDYNAIIASFDANADDGKKCRDAFASRAVQSGNFYIVNTSPLSESEGSGLSAEGKKNVNNILLNQEDNKSVSLNDLKTNKGLRDNIRNGILDPNPEDGDEADFFTAGATALEHGLNAMRVVEKRLNDYKKALARSEKVLDYLKSNASGWKDKLGEIDEKLEALRHDALVTRSLFEEEKSHLSAINERRKAIFNAYVTTLVFVRPRLVDTRLDVMSVPLYAEYVNPVPACLAEDFEATGELEDMLSVFREIPVSWLTEASGLVKVVTTASGMADVLKQAKNRTYKTAADTTPQTASYQTYNTNEYGKTINKIITANTQYKQVFAKQKASLDITNIAGKTWLQLVETAETQVSLADLIENGKGTSKLAARAGEIMESLEDIAVCLYHLCDELDPVIKLQWANLISVYDKPVDLRYLEALPSFDKIDFTTRRNMQNMVDWLFSQVDISIDKARETMNDLVRVCILLACHAPVSTLIKGYVGTPSTGKIGDFIDVTISKGQIKIGMAATVLAQGAVAAQGIVTDVGQSSTRIKVTQTAGNSAEFSIDKGAQVNFASGKYFNR